MSDTAFTPPSLTNKASTQVNLHRSAITFIEEGNWLAHQKRKNAGSKAEAEMYDRLIRTKAEQYEAVMGLLVESPELTLEPCSQS